MVGLPVDKARTPALFNAWAGKAGHDMAMVGLPIGEAGLGPLFSTMRHCASCLGAVITYPHKQAAYALLDEADDAARFNEACNVVRREADGRLVGTMTDGIGCVSAMEGNGARLDGADLLLVGAGGAGSAIAHEAARRGARRIAVVDLDTQRRTALCRRLEAAFPALLAAEEIPPGFRFDVACNATPLGMRGETALPFPVEPFGTHTLVVDVIPTPAVTPFLAAAKARGLAIQTGPEMVAGQFAHVVAHLTGLPAAAIGAAGPARPTAA